jgi:hypothetical protein
MHLLVISHNESSAYGHESLQNALFLVTHGCPYAADTIGL